LKAVDAFAGDGCGSARCSPAGAACGFPSPTAAAPLPPWAVSLLRRLPVV
jgi:hypothetical protein